MFSFAGFGVDRPKQIGGLSEVLQRQFKEQLLARVSFLHFLANAIVVVVTVLDGVVEDGGVRGKSRNREFLNVAAECALLSRPRVMLSSQRLWPISWNFG